MSATGYRAVQFADKELVFGTAPAGQRVERTVELFLNARRGDSGFDVRSFQFVGRGSFCWFAVRRRAVRRDNRPSRGCGTVA